MRKKKVFYGFIIAAVLCMTSCGDDEAAEAGMQAEAEVSEPETDVQAETVAIGTEIEVPEDVSADAEPGGQADGTIDVDLTQLSSTMVYSEVYNMMINPEDYLGRMVKMNGMFATYENEETGQIYFACIISDATACCSQGIEFELVGDYSYPDDYPELGSDITVTGIFETYDEDGYTYCRLKNAKLG